MKKIREYMNQIENSKNVIVFADKSSNIYKMDPEKYKKMLKENVTEGYKKAPNQKIDQINQEASLIIARKSIKGKIPALEEKTAFVTIKDHKKNFPKKIDCMLINPSKSFLGKVSKRILDEINEAIRNNNRTNQWQNTSQVISWFKATQDKDKKDSSNLMLSIFILA